MIAKLRGSQPIIPQERPNSNCIAGRLRDLRLDQKLKLREMAEIIQVKPDTYRAYEEGRRQIRGESLRLIAVELNVDTDWLLTGKLKGKA